jgi:hypothetical protein
VSAGGCPYGFGQVGTGTGSRRLERCACAC